MHTTAYWLTVPRAVMAALPYAADDRRDGVVGLSFAMRQVAQLLLMCDRQRHRHLDRQGDDAQGETEPDRRPHGACPRRSPTSRASSSTTTIPAASASARRCSRMHARAARAHARADCRLRLRARLPDVRRPDRQHRAARQDGGAGAAGARSSGMARPAASAPRCRPARGLGRRGRAVLMAMKPSLADRLRAVVGGRVRCRRVCRDPRPMPLGAAATVAPDIDGATARRPPPRHGRGGDAGRRRATMRADGRVHRRRPALRRRRLATAGIWWATSSRTCGGRPRAWPRCGRAWPGRAAAAPLGRRRCVQDARRRCASSTSRPPAWPAAPARRRSSSAARASTATACTSGSSCRRASSTNARSSRRSAEWMRDRTQLVTFNGRTFDLPLLEMRFSFHRLAWPVGATCRTSTCCIRRAASGATGPSWPVRTPTRRAARWACSSSAWAGVHRVGDVPGFEIPARYFQFARDGRRRAARSGARAQPPRPAVDAAGVRPRRRRWSCAGPAPPSSGYECLGLGRIYDRLGSAPRPKPATRSRGRGGGRMGDGRLRGEALRRLALCDRRAGRADAAAEAWRRLLATPRRVRAGAARGARGAGHLTTSTGPATSAAARSAGARRAGRAPRRPPARARRAPPGAARTEARAGRQPGALFA